MQREDLAKVCEFLRPHEEELEDAVFIGVMLGDGAKEFHDAWSKIWSRNLPKDQEWRHTLFHGLRLLASTALQNAKSKTIWFNDCTNVPILSAFPASEFLVYEKEAVKATDLWLELGGSLFGPSKRMIAPKFDPIWIKLSDYGAPWGVVRIDWLGASIGDVSASSLRELNISYAPKGWVSDLISRKKREESERTPRLDPAYKKYLLDRLRADIEEVPRSDPKDLLWTGDPFKPSDFEDVFHVLPMI